MDNWNWIEVVWTLVAIVGVYFSSRNVNLGLQDLKVLQKSDDKDLTWNLINLIAKGNLRRDILRIVIQTIFIALGLFAGNTPSGPNGLTLGAILFGMSLIIPSAILSLSAITDYSDRIKATEIGKLIEAKRKHIV